MNLFIASVFDNKGILTNDESWHCTKVLRKKKGDHIRLIDGAGNFFNGVLDFVSEKQCLVIITEGPFHQIKHNYYLHLAIAPTKQIDRIEWMIEKGVEIGVDEISFIQSTNSERTTIKIDRIIKIVESAVKQSLQAFIPKVNEIINLNNFLIKSNADQKFIAHCNENSKLNIRQIDFKQKNTIVLIGPEGDFSKLEIELANQHNYQSLSLGTNRLRTETAGLFICQAASLLT